MSELPAGWIEAELSEIAEVVLGQSPPGTSYNADSKGTPFLQGKTEFGELRPTIRKWTTDPRKIAKADDVLLSVRAPVGPTNLAPFECCIGRGLAAIRPLGGIDPMYVLYGMRATERLLAAKATGTTFEAVSGAQVRAHRLPVAPLNEQRRIVAAIEEHLSRLDAADASLAAALHHLEALREQSYLAAASNGAPTMPLRELLREPLRNGHSAKASQNGTVRTLTLSAVTRGEFTDQNTKLTAADPEKVKSLWLEPGDIFVERSNTPELVGTAALYKGPLNWAIFPDLLIRVRVGDGVLPEYVEIVLKAPPARRYFQQAAQGIAGSMPKIDQGVVERLEVPVPPLEEQRRIVAEVEERLSLIDALRASIERAQRRSKALRAAILERAFRGELVPQDPADEPAEALLARIRAGREAVAPKTPRRARA